MGKFIREHSLTLAMFLLFAFAIIGQTLTGWNVYNEDQQEHGSQPVGLGEYLTTGHFGEAVFENWESEFLQMGVYVLLTVWLRQRGAAESKPIDGDDEVDREPDPNRRDAPWPVRRGRLARALYSNSLSIALISLFVLSFALHAVTGAAEYSEEQVAHGGEAVTPMQYLGTSQMWFESFQNWQSEFLSIGVLVVLSIYLRQHGSTQSKRVDAPVSETGT
jgi:hypothetical protein